MDLIWWVAYHSRWQGVVLMIHASPSSSYLIRIRGTVHSANEGQRRPRVSSIYLVSSSTYTYLESHDRVWTLTMNTDHSHHTVSSIPTSTKVEVRRAHSLNSLTTLTIETNSNSLQFSKFRLEFTRGKFPSPWGKVKTLEWAQKVDCKQKEVARRVFHFEESPYATALSAKT